MKKWYEHPYFIGAVFAGIVLLLSIVAINKFKHRSTQLEKSVALSPSQQQIVKELRKAKADADQALAELAKSKAEFQQMINDARATAVSKNIDPNVQTYWLDMRATGWPTSNDKPILVGFRTDGLIMWKSQ